MHWINDYLYKPWVAYARGPDAYDCWGLVMDVLHRHFGCSAIDPHDDVTTDSHEDITRAFYQEIESGAWEPSTLAQHGSVVVCWQYRDKKLMVRHVGIYLNIEGGGVLHSRDHVGIRFDHLRTLQTGFPKVAFYNRTPS